MKKSKRNRSSGPFGFCSQNKKGSNVCCPFLSSFFLARYLYPCPEMKTNTPGTENFVYKYRKKGYPLAVHEEGQTEAK